MNTKIMILCILTFSLLTLGCVLPNYDTPNFEAKDYACQEFIKNGSYNTTFIKIQNYNGGLDQDGYVGIIKEATMRFKQGWSKNDIRTKIVFKDGITIVSREYGVHSNNGWRENQTYLVNIPMLYVYELDCNDK